MTESGTNIHADIPLLLQALWLRDRRCRDRVCPREQSLASSSSSSSSSWSSSTCRATSWTAAECCTAAVCSCAGRERRGVRRRLWKREKGASKQLFFPCFFFWRIMTFLDVGWCNKVCILDHFWLFFYSKSWCMPVQDVNVCKHAFAQTAKKNWLSTRTVPLMSELSFYSLKNRM